MLDQQNFRGNQPIKAIHNRKNGNNHRRNISSLSQKISETNSPIRVNARSKRAFAVPENQIIMTQEDLQTFDFTQKPANNSHLNNRTNSHADGSRFLIQKMDFGDDPDLEACPVPHTEDRHVLYALKHNVQFSASTNQNHNNLGEEIEFKEKFESNKEKTESVKNFSQIQQNYCEMKRLQTSKGQRVNKYRAGKEVKEPHFTTNETKEAQPGQNKTTQNSRSGLLNNASALVNLASINQKTDGEHTGGEQIQRSGTVLENQIPPNFAINTSQNALNGHSQNFIERPPQTAPSSEMQRIQRIKKNDHKFQMMKGILKEYKDEQDMDFLNQNSSEILGPMSKDEFFEGDDTQIIGSNQVQFSRTIDNLNGFELNQVNNFQPVNNINLSNTLQKGGSIPHTNLLNNQESTNEQKPPAPPPQGIESIVPLGYQFEQWQRPPSRQKEPNQAIGFDDEWTKNSRGNNSIGYHFGNQIGAQHISGRERKRNIQQYIPQQNPMFQVGPNENVQGIRSGANINIPMAGNRSRVIDFFHQRNNNINGFNSSNEQTQQFFQMQYQQINDESHYQHSNRGGNVTAISQIQNMQNVANTNQSLQALISGSG